MPGFDIGNSVNSVADWFCRAPIVKTVVSSPIYTSLLITAMITIILMAMYQYEIREKGFKLAARTVLCILFVTTSVMFVHHYCVSRAANDSASQNGIRGIFNNILSQRTTSNIANVPVGAAPTGDAALGDAEPKSGAGEQPQSFVIKDVLLDAKIE